MSLTDDRGIRITDDTLLILLNSYYEQVDFVVPLTQPGEYWEMRLDTGKATGRREFRAKGGDTFQLGANSLVMFCVRVKGEI
jgi:isoamylase